MFGAIHIIRAASPKGAAQIFWRVYEMNLLQQTQRLIIRDMLHTINDTPYDAAILSAIGGRVCYSKDNPLDFLFDDKRITDPEERYKYLNRIRGMGHFSIFAHSPLSNIASLIGDAGPTGLYKTYPIIEDNVVYEIVNLRHVVEHTEDYDIIIDEGYSIKYYIGNLDTKEINVIDSANRESFRDLDRFVIFSIVNIGGMHKWWVAAIAYGVSRVLTHQLVRHTWFNFSQRSFRYTNTFGVRVPDSLKPLFDDPNFECGQSYDRCYWELINEYKARKEDARYFYPMGAKSTIMFSGPIDVFADFYEKRSEKAAQKEIRDLAILVGDFIRGLR